MRTLAVKVVDFCPLPQETGIGTVGSREKKQRQRMLKEVGEGIDW